MSNETPFYLTRMGREFYDRTMPDLVRQLIRLNNNLERALAAAERNTKAESGKAPSDAEEPL